MTQHQFHFDDEKPVYLIDSSSISELEGSHRTMRLSGMPAEPPAFSDEETLAIWNGLASMASEGRLKLLTPVAIEAQRWSPETVKRIRELPSTRCSRTESIRAGYQIALEAYPDWQPRGLGEIDQGDPWLWSTAIDRGWAIISEEKRREDMADPRNRRKETKLPDA